MKRLSQFFAALAAVLIACFSAPLAAAAATESLSTGQPAGPAVLLLLLSIGLGVGATITGAVRLNGKLFRPGQWEAFLRAAREAKVSVHNLQRLAENGDIELEEGESPEELLAASDDGEADALEGVDFTTTGIREKALDKGLVAADFEGFEASSESGFTTDDVDTVASAKEEE